MGTSILELGTRTFRLFRTYLGPDRRVLVEPIATERVSIDASVDATGAIGPNCWTDAVRLAGRLMARIPRSAGGDQIIVFAPHAFGGAGNAKGFALAVRRRLGVSVALLSAGDSAGLAYCAARCELGLARGEGAQNCEPVGVIYLGDPAIDIAAGTGSSCEFTETLSLGIARLHRAYGASERGLSSADSSALFSLVQLSGGPACRRFREWGTPTIMVGSENAVAVRNVARSWGYLDADSNDLCRLSLHALVPEILDAAPESLCELGVDPARSSLVGTTAVVIDALADLLGQREVRFADFGVAEGAALIGLAEMRAVDAPPRRVSEFRLASGTAGNPDAGANATADASATATADVIATPTRVGAATTLPRRHIRSTVA